MALLGFGAGLVACGQEPAEPLAPLAGGNLVVTVSPIDGGRIASLRFYGRELLTQADARTEGNWGSTLWVSPQAAWDWPPPKAFDAQPFSYEQSANQLRLQGQVDAQTGIKLHKQITLLGGDRLQLAYGLENPGKAPVQAAGWEVTRVPQAGLVVFATQAPVWLSHGELAYEQFGDLVWLDARKPVGRGKLNANGRGWLAWVQGRDLWIKRFDDLAEAQQAPGEAELQVFVGNRGYLELEAQGAYQTIAPGARAAFTTEWQLVRLPADVEVGVDSPSLQTLLQSLGLKL
ncbi:DUF4380 domain-containing protein [Simiduia sp. 21SJ11W-1]|uniref:DUF4380 domain-containing protein n=1 Tax=Simiduia sp. 21SJ11W-1 TaxID=2909669 RepID=UPI0020A013F6|nr:DUF4380 domain-containing protein [Simiduia sp. 21SJ11W-1]UTA47774.1 DUF4380 domain-containing protein [Simiduia sp. 21SJ11W-1]